MESNIQNGNSKIMKPARNANPDRDANLDRAVERIYEQYGTDLSEFFRDAYREASKCQSSKNHTDD